MSTLEGMTWILDPGHGWLRVVKSVYPDAVNHGTGYGYEDELAVYLEEDCEAGSFLRSLGFTPDNRPDIAKKYSDLDAPCRGYARNRDLQGA